MARLPRPSLSIPAPRLRALARSEASPWARAASSRRAIRSAPCRSMAMYASAGFSLSGRDHAYRSIRQDCRHGHCNACRRHGPRLGRVRQLPSRGALHDLDRARRRHRHICRSHHQLRLSVTDPRLRSYRSLSDLPATGIVSKRCAHPKPILGCRRARCQLGRHCARSGSIASKRTGRPASF